MVKPDGRYLLLVVMDEISLPYGSLIPLDHIHVRFWWLDEEKAQYARACQSPCAKVAYSFYCYSVPLRLFGRALSLFILLLSFSPILHSLTPPVSLDEPARFGTISGPTIMSPTPREASIQDTKYTDGQIRPVQQYFGAYSEQLGDS